MSSFEDNIKKIYREKGVDWLANLPNRVQEYAVLWKLTDLKPLENLSHHFVLAGYQEQKPIILKLGPDPVTLSLEAKALKAFSEYGAVDVLNQSAGALLLQRAWPGHPLSIGAIEIACHVMEKLHRAPVPSENAFPKMKDWLKALDQSWNIPEAHLRLARKLKSELRAEAEVLLHGDLHRENILSNGKEWMVIDPKGVIGSPIHEIWALVEKPKEDLLYISRYFGFDFEETAQWYYIHLVLAACWRIEDGLDPKRFLDLADLAKALISAFK